MDGNHNAPNRQICENLPPMSNHNGTAHQQIHICKKTKTKPQQRNMDERMKNKELIKLLKNYNQEADVTLTTSEDITISYICKDPRTDEKLTPQTTRQMFIEPTDACPSCTSEYMQGDIRWCSFYDCPCKDVTECNQYEELDER